MKRGKKGISAIIGSVILIAIVLAAGVIVWGVVNNMVDDNLEGSGSCSNLMGKIELNSGYTCFDSNNDSLVFSITLGDVEVDGILISLSKSGSTKTIEFINGTGPTGGETINEYPGNSVSANELPGRNEGSTYIYNATGSSFSDGVDLIEISPIIGGNRCSPIDSISEIPPCSSMGITLS